MSRTCLTPKATKLRLRAPTATTVPPFRRIASPRAPRTWSSPRLVSTALSYNTGFSTRSSYHSESWGAPPHGGAPWVARVGVNQRHACVGASNDASCRRGRLAQAPRQVWLADPASSPPAMGWLHLAAVLDLFTRKIVGRFRRSTRYVEIALGLLHMAIERQRPVPGLTLLELEKCQNVSLKWARAATGKPPCAPRRIGRTGWGPWLWWPLRPPRMAASSCGLGVWSPVCGGLSLLSAHTGRSHGPGTPRQRHTTHAIRAAIQRSKAPLKELAARYGLNRKTVRQPHAAGEKVFVDFAGDTIDVIDPVTGLARAMKLFVAALGASSYVYCEARPSEGLADWIGCHVGMFAFFGGVTAIIAAHFADRGRAVRAMVGADFTRSWAVWSLTDGGYGSVAEGGVKGAAARDPAHAPSSHVEAGGGVDEAVEDGVGQGRIADHLVPLLDGDLAGDEGGSAAVAILEDFQEIDALGLGGHRQAPVVGDEQIDAGQGLE